MISSPMKTVGLIAAMHNEYQPLLRIVKQSKRIKVGQYKGYRFKFSRWDCVLVECGWGAYRAKHATEELIKEFHPVLLISFGIAGAVENTLKIGDVVEIHFSNILEKNRLSKSQPLTSLSAKAHSAIDQALKLENARFFTGTAITTKGSQMVEHSKSLENPVLEMETSGIVQASRENGVPIIALRAISDGPQDPIPFDLSSMMDDDYNLKVGKLIWAVIRHPKMLFQSAKLTKNSELAERNAAVAVLAALNHTLPFV